MTKLYRTIINPLNKKKYKINSIIGKQILQNYLHAITKHQDGYQQEGGQINSDHVHVKKITNVKSHPFIVQTFEMPKSRGSILLIGEEHEYHNKKHMCKKKDPHCYTMEKLYTTLFEYTKNMNCPLDFFIEDYTPKQNKQISNKNIYGSIVKTEESMMKVWKNRFTYTTPHKFRTFMTKNTNGSMSKLNSNVHVHLIDLRYMFDGKLNLFEALNLLGMDIEKQFPWFKMSKTNMEAVLHSIILPLTKKATKGTKILKKFGVEIGDINKFIGKNMMNDQLAQSLNNSESAQQEMRINTYGFNEFINLYRSLIQIIIKHYDNSNQFLKTFIKSVVSIAMVFGSRFFFHTLNCLLMDLYTLNKMFTDHRKNIMFYGGGWHTMVYCQFVKSMFGKNPVVASKNKIFQQLKINLKYTCSV